MKNKMVYPDFVKKQEVFAEDIEEAVYQYLIANGVEIEEGCGMQFQGSDGEWHTTKILSIRWR